MLTDLCAATEADRGSLADFSATLYQTVKILYDDAVPNRKDPLGRRNVQSRRGPEL